MTLNSSRDRRAQPASKVRHRGNCSVCGFRCNVLRDRVTIAQHMVYSGSEGRVCPGSGQPEKYAAVNAAARRAYALNREAANG